MSIAGIEFGIFTNISPNKIKEKVYDAIRIIFLRKKLQFSSEKNTEKMNIFNFYYQFVEKNLENSNKLNTFAKEKFLIIYF